ncbi:Hint domain-containing protein [Commensalibacter intestini]|uniref:Hint domain-containing protein n=1 Tax=Commensalibacter intestini TaxID=479936 RepID=UPI000A36C229|nr:Hint domain-containing protein [Commensalibacter intestini]
MPTISSILNGITQNTLTYNTSGDSITVYGQANNFTIANAAVLNVLYGGATSGTNVQAQSIENVYTYGSAIATVVNNGGIQNVVDNGSTTSTIVNNGGLQKIHDNASAYVTILNSGGVQSIYNGGSAFYTTVHSGGYITTTQNGVSFQPYIESNGYEDVGYNRMTKVSNVGSSISAQLYGGSQYVYSGSIASATTVFNNGSSYILAGGSAFNTIVNSGGFQLVAGSTTSTTLNDTGVLNVIYGGITSSTNIKGKSAENVFNQGSATGTIVSNNGAQNVYDNGSTTSTIVNNSASQNIHNNGSAYVTVLNSGGVQNIYDGGSAFYTTVKSGGYVAAIQKGLSFQAYIESGGYEDIGYNKITNSSGTGSSVSAQLYGGSQYVYSGSVESAATIFNGGTSYILTGGSAVSTIIYSGGSQSVNGVNAIASNTTLSNTAILNVANGGITSGTTIQTSSVENILGNGSAISTLVNSGGSQIISGSTNSFGSATGTIIQGGGQQTIYDWGRAGGITLSGGTINISAGGGINDNVNFASGGTINVYSGAGVSTQITSGGKEYIYSGGIANNTLVDNASQVVLNGGQINSTTISDNGTVDVSAGGIASNVIVNSAGILRISNGTVNTITVNNNGITVVNGGSVNNNTVQYGGIFNITDGVLGDTTVNSGGAILISIDTVDVEGNVSIKTGAFINDREALEDITINGASKMNLTALLNDPTLFATTDASKAIADKTATNKEATVNLDTNKTQNSSSSVNTNKKTNSLKDLLNNPNYFAPVTVTPQATSLQTRDFVTPETLSVTTTDYPTTDGDGNPITDVTPVTDTTASTELQVWTYKLASGFGRTSFVPPGHADTDRIWGIQLYSATDGGVISTVSSLIAGTGSYGRLTGKKFSKPVYAAEGATITTEQNFTEASNVYIYDNATLQATQGAIDNLYVDDGGTANFSDTATVGTLTLESGGKANITTSTGGIISLEGTDNTGLVISGKASAGGTTIASTIDNFDGNDSITLEDVQRSDVAGVTFGDADHITITLNDGSSITLNIPGIESTGYTLGENSDGNVVFETCFLTGTLIAMISGMTNVENIQVGEIIETFDWKTNQTINTPVIWVGHKHMTVKTYLPDDLAGYPVRVLKNAISENVPNEDLLITPEHCLFFNGNFIPARMLVNGRSIYYDRSITSYDYYHIETEAHSVIWANNTLTETYLDTGNRNTFENNHKVISLFNQAKSWDQDGAAPLNVQRHVVEPIYNQLNNNAIDKNLELKTEELSLTNNPEFCLMTECGTIISAHSINNGRYIFPIPEDIHTVQLCSRTYRPNETIGAFIDDRRELGILVGSILIIGHNVFHAITDHLSNPNLKGWDAIEESSCRWTNGQATLNIHQNHSQKRVLIVNILAAGPYINKNNREEVVVEKIAS